MPRSRPQSPPSATWEPEKRQEYASRVDQARNKRQRRDEVDGNQAGQFNTPPRYQADDDDYSEEPHRSCDLDDDDESLPYSQELRLLQCQAIM